MPAKFDHISYPIPNMDFEGNAIVAKQEQAEWRLICIPGAPSLTFLFKRLLQLTPVSLETVVVNRLGYGKTDNEPVLDFHLQAKIVEPFLKDKRNILLGISYGGAIALTAALNYPDKIEGVITGAALVNEPRDYAKAIVDFKSFDHLESITPRILRHMRAEIKGRRSQIPSLLNNLSNLSIPVEVIHGTLDTLVPLDDAQTLMAAIGGNAHYKEIVGGTHYLEMQMPQQIINAAIRIIQRIEDHA